MTIHAIDIAKHRIGTARVYTHDIEAERFGGKRPVTIGRLVRQFIRRRNLLRSDAFAGAFYEPEFRGHQAAMLRDFRRASKSFEERLSLYRMLRSDYRRFRRVL